MEDGIAKMKEWIDQASYGELLRRWRMAPVGSPWFAGEPGGYYWAALKAKRLAVGEQEHVRVSKAIGW